MGEVELKIWEIWDWIESRRADRERETENLVRLLKKKTFLLKHNTTINVLNGAHFPPAKTEAGSEPTTCRYDKLTSPTIFTSPTTIVDFFFAYGQKKYWTFNVFVDTDEEKRQAFLGLTVVWSLFSTQTSCYWTKVLHFQRLYRWKQGKRTSFPRKDITYCCSKHEYNVIRCQYYNSHNTWINNPKNNLKS